MTIKKKNSEIDRPGQRITSPHYLEHLYRDPKVLPHLLQ